MLADHDIYPSPSTTGRGSHLGIGSIRKQNTQSSARNNCRRDIWSWWSQSNDIESTQSAIKVNSLRQRSSGDKLIAFDKDLQAIAEAKTIQDPRFQIIHESFASMAEHISPETVDGVLLDLGISSPQIDDPDRGFSFRQDGPLDMRMDTTRGQSAAEWLATAEQKEIARVIKDYGEERFALQIAKAIVTRREQGESLTRTRELASLVASVVRTREAGQDPATR
ncbi:MAG: hypothetical protein RIR85_1102, partial [Pseudomonadota bacterium]